METVECFYLNIQMGSSQFKKTCGEYREHLDWENDIVEQRVLRKSCSHNGVGCPEHLTHCKKDPMSSLTPSPDFVDRGHLDWEDDILER